jgi:hypothetical protein
MRKTSVFAVAAAVIATGLGVWAASPMRVSLPRWVTGLNRSS